jgi:NAD(P)-dependent dehydrogenase (short-subunit alcohol dehydrogenase family)
MSNEWILITGASTGIGRATVLHLARSGFGVVAGVRRVDDMNSLSQLSSDLRSSGRIQPVLLDVTNADQIRGLESRLSEIVQGGTLYALVNNAGIVCAGPSEGLPAEAWQQQFATNLFGPIALTAAVVPFLRRSRGRIVNVSSIGGRCSVPFMSAYTSSKFAMEAWSDALRVELKPDHILVSVIEPGSIATPIWAKGQEQASRTAARLPTHLQVRYGAAIEAFRAASERAASRAISPEQVAKAIHRALTARRPRTRYLVGRDARIQSLLKWMLPDRAMDAVLELGLGLRSIRSASTGTGARQTEN